MSKKKAPAPEIEIVENIRGAVLDEIMGERYAVYAKDVIQDRAIPDVRDGLKPVQRRIVFYMYENGNTIDKPTRKCAHIVGGVMGQYHPHGDASIYDALIRMSQTWNVREPFIDFQGNNGSMDGDGAAAMRYTEARLSRLSQELVRDLDKDTVDMQLTFDDLKKEPLVLPAHFPNLLVNGAEGIAVGMATHIPPHNLKEVVGALLYRLRHPDCEIESLLRYVEGPDFPTGGIIRDKKSIDELYRTGHAHISLVSRAGIETLPNGNKQIVITEIPYGTVKSQMVYAIDKLRADRAIPGIEEVRDETDKSGLRIAIDLKSGAKAESILAYLYSKPAGKGGISGSYSANMVAIVDGRPKTMDLVSYCDAYLSFRLDVERRRCLYDKAKNAARRNIVDGLLKALDILDDVIHTIRSSSDKADAKRKLCDKFGFNEDQAESIVMMPLYKLTHTDVNTLMAERDALEEERKQLEALLSDEGLLKDFVAEDLKRIAKTYGTPRRTTVEGAEESAVPSLDERDLIAVEDTYLVITRDGYLKRSSPKSYKGSGGDKGALPGLKQGDVPVYIGLAKTTDFFVAFTDLGNYLFVPVDKIKEGKWLDEGVHVNSFVTLLPGEKVVKGFAAPAFRNDLYFVLLSKNCLVKRVPLSAFPVTRRNRSFSAMRLSLDDRLRDVALTNGGSRLLVLSSDGYGEVYDENQIPLTNTKSGGVKAGLFKGKELSCVLSYMEGEKSKALLLTELGGTRVIDVTKYPMGKRLSKPFLVYPCFKNEPHKLLYAEWTGDREAPLSFKGLLSNGNIYVSTFEDFYLTPQEKYMKRPDGFVKKYPVLAYVPSIERSLPKDFKSVPLPVKEAAPEPEIEAISENSEPEQSNFEQISLFDDE